MYLVIRSVKLDIYGSSYLCTFNVRKTVCLTYSHCGDLTVPVVCLNGQMLRWEANVMHVGNIITTTLDDKDDIELNIHEYFCQVNKLFSDFQGLRHDVLSELFNKYCNSFYGSQVWDLRSKHVQGLYRVWNRGVRGILDLPYDSHHFLLPLLLQIPSLKAQLMKRFVKMCKTMYFSKYKSVSFFSILYRKGK